MRKRGLLGLVTRADAEIQVLSERSEKNTMGSYFVSMLALTRVSQGVGLHVVIFFNGSDTGERPSSLCPSGKRCEPKFEKFSFSQPNPLLRVGRWQKWLQNAHTNVCVTNQQKNAAATCACSGKLIATCTFPKGTCTWKEVTVKNPCRRTDHPRREQKRAQPGHTCNTCAHSSLDL